MPVSYSNKTKRCLSPLIFHLRFSPDSLSLQIVSQSRFGFWCSISGPERCLDMRCNSIIEFQNLKGGFVSIQLLKVGYLWIVKSDVPQQGKGDVKDAMKSMEKGRAATASSTKKLMNFSENFEAKLFLSRVHQDTSGADLKSGALGLKTDLKGRTQQRKLLVKDNFDCFVSCKTTIDGILVYIESKLKQIEDNPEGSETSHLFNLMQGVNFMASCAFKPLFERQAQTEKIRSAQGMLQRFRTLFNLPSTICGSGSKVLFVGVVARVNMTWQLGNTRRLCKKANSIALPSHVCSTVLLKAYNFPYNL
ncbi:hypothetical protein Dsin_024276 [Dipteronia sinensis]|uniref:Exocyst complex component SEC5 n=1 Tax=Dipteronia sinensis TaxID=43782 RepID=A0AAD9ZU66_9ROSI|nr:hypothetical protein Dsin_024276 [Dipteronia sinensis]